MEPKKTRARGLIRAFQPCLGPAESAALKAALESGWLGTGIYTRLFEARLAKEAGRRLALATNSGTAALHLALQVLDVEGGEVVTTPVTNVATGHAILYNRAAPVFCDVDPETGNIDPGLIPGLLSRRTKAIVVVHLGQACDMDAVLAVARARRIPVVEDACACAAVGAFYKGRPLGSLGDIGAFSFGRFKSLTTLDGGALVLDRKPWHERLCRLRRLGLAEDEGGMAKGPGGVSELGFHYRMNDLAAVLGLTQLQRREALQARLSRILARYSEGLRDVPFLETIALKPFCSGIAGHAAVKVLAGRRDPLRRFLQKSGIQLNDSLFPCHRYALYRPFRRRLPAAERFCGQTLQLPYHPALRDAEVDRILDAIHGFKG